MEYDDVDRINQLLDGSTHVEVGQLLQDGRIGLAVVKELARGHGIAVRLQPNIYGGIDASIVIPRELLDPHTMSVGAGRRVSATRRATGLPAATSTGSHPVVPSAPTQQPAPTPAREPALTAPSGAGRHSDRASGVPDPRSAPSGPDNGRPPPLPTRRRDAATSALPNPPGIGELAATDATAEAAPDSPSDQRPALPKRRAQPSHLRPELLAPAAPVRPIPEPNLDLMADLRLGRERGQAELDGDERRQPPIDPHPQGDPSRWPTT
jgi:hypothetical protein